MGKWYAGVVHSHTTRSDGINSPGQLIELAEKTGLDFIMITDHNNFCESVPYSSRTLVIPGTELTTENGHTNIWGVQVPIDNFVCDTYEEWERKVAMAKEKGATVCINHPLCSNCGWRWPLEAEKADCVEIWNSPQHTDNMICTAWWQDELRKGKKIPAVGGSDFHRTYGVAVFLDNPVTYVYAEECTQEAILNGIKAGRCTISPKVGGQMIEITSGNAVIGDTVKLTDDTCAIVKVNVIKKGQTLKVIDSWGVRFQYKATKTGPYSVTLPILSKGFICAQVEYDLNPVYSAVYGKIEQKILHSNNSGKLPPFIYSQTSAMYFE